MFTYAPMHPPNYMHAHSLTMLVSYTSIHMHEYIQIHMFTHTHIQIGCTALNTAATQGHKDVVQLLLEARADPDLQGKVMTSKWH